MIALTIKQPWAWLIFHAGKDIENRNWKTSFRGRFAVHTSGRVSFKEYEDAIFYVQDFISEEIAFKIPDYTESENGVILGTVELTDCVNSSNSDWFCGDYGFVLARPELLKVSILCKGNQMFWEVPKHIERTILTTDLIKK